MAGLSIQNVGKCFGETEVLRNISLSVRDGEFISLVGPSGCGKSTLLRIIAGLERQTSGDIHIGNRNVSGIRPMHRDVAMVFQSYALYPHLTLFDNIAVPLRMRRLSRLHRLPLVGRYLPGRRGTDRAIADRVGAVAETLGIAHLLDRKPGQLSGGQRQRVAVARAMVREPQAFLMDEPLSNLDAKLRVHMRTEIAELHRRLGATFVYVTHDQAEAMTMSDRIAVMIDGDLLQVASPEVIYGNPVDIRVAEFIGSPKINILPGVVSQSGAIVVCGRHLAVYIDAAPDTLLRVGVRPENVRVTEPNAGDLVGQVRHAENLGSDYLLHIEIDPKEPRTIVRIPPAQHGFARIGAEVGLELPRGGLLIFGSDGRRLPLAALAPAREVVNG
ncbi:MAG: ABC transporter ATP-binding protein [Alphaproteobacteria bacterium]|nr:ABC transporter ATP-binding protein [Alphaproteobacteria bacterium]